VNAQFNQAVGKQNSRSLLYVFSECLKCSADQRCGTGNVAGRNGQSAARLQQYLLMIFKLGSSDFWSLEIAEDAQGFVLFAADLADHLNQCQFLFVSPVRKVEADNIDSGADEIAEDGFRVGRRPQSRNNLRASLGRGIGQAEFKGHSGRLR
jgi:hypothetical protein